MDKEGSRIRLVGIFRTRRLLLKAATVAAYTKHLNGHLRY